MTEEIKEKELVEVERVPPKPYWFWMKNSRGEASASLTLLSVAFTVTTIAFLLSMFEVLGPLTIREFDVGAASVYFIPLLSLYFGRRFTDAKFPNVANGVKKD